MLATMQNASNTQHLWGIAAGLGVGFLVVTLVVVYLMRKSFQNRREEQKEEFKTSAPRTENPSAFMAASMQGVIQQLREQEKELERLHRIEKERAEQTERLSEEVTRNMPAGLVVVNATGIISTSNPAAEQVLGIRARAGIPAVQRGAGRGLGPDEADCGVPFERENISARRSGTYHAGGGHAASGRYDFADPERRGENQRGDLPADGFDGTCRAAAKNAIEGKPGGAGGIVRGNRARVQERAGDHFGLCTADPVGVIGGGGPGIRGTHSGTDAKHLACGDGVLEVCAAAGNPG